MLLLLLFCCLLLAFFPCRGTCTCPINQIIISSLFTSKQKQSRVGMADS
jgi:hypothetical protein